MCGVAHSPSVTLADAESNGLVVKRGMAPLFKTWVFDDCLLKHFKGAVVTFIGRYYRNCLNRGVSFIFWREMFVKGVVLCSEIGLGMCNSIFWVLFNGNECHKFAWGMDGFSACLLFVVFLVYRVLLFVFNLSNETD